MLKDLDFSDQNKNLEKTCPCQYKEICLHEMQLFMGKLIIKSTHINAQLQNNFTVVRPNGKYLIDLLITDLALIIYLDLPDGSYKNKQQNRVILLVSFNRRILCFT